MSEVFLPISNDSGFFFSLYIYIYCKNLWSNFNSCNVPDNEKQNLSFLLLVFFLLNKSSSDSNANNLASCPSTHCIISTAGDGQKSAVCCLQLLMSLIMMLESTIQNGISTGAVSRQK